MNHDVSPKKVCDAYSGILAKLKSLLIRRPLVGADSVVCMLNSYVISSIRLSSVLFRMLRHISKQMAGIIQPITNNFNLMLGLYVSWRTDYLLSNANNHFGIS
jgi:hypothetical protein